MQNTAVVTRSPFGPRSSEVFSYFSWVQAVLGALFAGGAMVGGALVGEHETLGISLVAGCGGAALLMAFVALRRRGTLVIGERLVYRRGRLRIDLPLQAVEAVYVRRPLWPLQRPTDYAVRVRIRERTFLLSFAEHWLFGRAAMARARRVAQLAGCAIEDPRGDRLRRSRLRSLQWRAHGDDWKLVALVLAVAGGIGAALVLLL